MLITYHGHAQFLIQLANGYRILTDPFDPNVPWPFRRTQADLVTISHEHFDHTHVEKVDGQPQVIRGLGTQKLPNGLRVTGLPSFHDDAQGAKRGENTITLIEADGLHLAHLGDLGDMPRHEVIEALEDLDLILVPVGGTYTLDAAQAAQLMQLLRPKVIIPMHFKKGEQGFQNIGPAEDFISAMAPMQASRQPLLRVTKEDISQAPELVVLEVAP